MARALAAIERSPDGNASLALLDAAYRAPRAQVVGLTGPPGVGRSSLLAAMITALRARGERLGVIAVDPSSKRSGGALLGDRVRLSTDPEDPGVFVRSMAARDRLGGLADLTLAAMVLMRAVYDHVLIETVGVGQSETDVAGVADTVLFCIQPGSGDSVQFMKAGIIEIPHIALVTKADLGAPAERALADLKSALALARDGAGWEVRTLMLSVRDDAAVESLIASLDSHARYLAEADRLRRARQAQAQTWLHEALRERFGQEGLKRAGAVSLAPAESPFRRLAQLSQALTA